MRTMAAPRTRRRAGPRRPYAARVPADVRREQLLDAALTVTAAAGFTGVTMEAVARQAGVTKPVLYELFPERGALYTALLDREEARALDQLRDIVPSDFSAIDPAVLLGSSLRALVGAVHARPEVWTVLLHAPEGMPPGVRERYVRRRAELVATIRTLVIAGRMMGYDLGSADDELLAESLVAVGELAGRLALREPDRFTAARLGDFFTDLAAGMLRSTSTETETTTGV